jgi:hypothetical protein
MRTIENAALARLTRSELRALQPLSPEQLTFLQADRRGQGKCGSLQTADGLPCERAPKFGWTVCRKHGERAPQTAAKAERLLAVARMPAIEWILDALDKAQEETCEACGYPSHTLKESKRYDTLAFRLLDRTGFGPHSKIDFNVSQSDAPGVPLENWSDEERQELRGHLAAVRALKERVAYRLASDVGRQARDTIEGRVVQQALTSVTEPPTPVAAPVDYNSD